MRNRVDSRPAISTVDERRILELEQRSIRIPSSTFEEGEIADLYANTMADIGLDVEMMEVIHPENPAKKSRQPIGRLRGTGQGPTLMLNGHMDPGAEMTGWTVDPFGAKFEDGWIWGIGAHDDEGGFVAAISAVEAIVRSVRRQRAILVGPCDRRRRELAACDRRRRELAGAPATAFPRSLGIDPGRPWRDPGERAPTRRDIGNNATLAGYANTTEIPVPAGGEPHKIEGVRHVGRFIKIIHAPDETALRIAPCTEILGMDVADAQHAGDIFEFRTDRFDALCPAEVSRAKENKGAFPHPFVLVRKVGLDHLATAAQPVLKSLVFFFE
jgi:hypothetical protein